MRRKLYNTLTKISALFVILCSGIASSGQVPVANFTGSPLAGCSPLIVVFQDQSTGNPTSWSWDFGNGNTSSLRNPTATYFTAGFYTVKLTVTNANGSNTLTRTQYVNVYQVPTANFTSNTTSGCYPLFVQFTDLSTPGVGNTTVLWEWDFGNGTTSNLQNPLAVYTASGMFPVTLKVTNDKGCTRTISRPNYIVVTNGVDASFTNTQPSVCGAPAVISFTNTSTGPGSLSYSWNFGDGNFSTATNPVHTYTSNGTFTPLLTVSSSAGCTDTVSGTPIVIGGFTSSFNSPDTVCVNVLATFINTSVPTQATSNWTFGDGGTASGDSVTHTYSTPGNYTVWLYNTFSTCNDSIPRNIVVSGLPVVDFTSADTGKCQPPLIVNFQDLTPGAISWQWNFGDGGTSTQQNPVHTYNAYGNFNVTLIVTTSGGCIDSITKIDYITIRRPNITIPQFPARGCIPLTLTVIPTIVSVDPIISYDWDFGDGGTSTLANPTHTWVAQGTYNVRLITTTSTGCRDTLMLYDAVKVGSKPVANFTGGPTPVCAFQPVQFTDLSAPADQWLWDFGDGGTSTLQNPSYNYTDTGYFTVTLIAYNNGCGDTTVRVNYIYVLPPISRFVSQTNCSNRLEFSFTDQSIAPLTWQWDFGDGGTSTSQNPVHIFPALGVYSVTLIVTNGSCTHSVTHQVRVIDANPDFTASPLAACKRTVINFTAQNLNFPDIASYIWDFGDGSQVTTTTPTTSHTYLTTGNFSVILVTIDINGCRDTIAKSNYIRSNGPVANFSATNTSGCVGLTTTFNDLSTNDGVNSIVNWQWDFGDGAVQNFSAPPFQHTYNVPGNFSIKLTVTDAAGCLDSLRINNLVIVTDPVPNFYTLDTLSCPGGTVDFVNSSVGTGFSSYWEFGDGGTSTAFLPSHVYTATGFYNVKLRILDMFGCADSITKNMYIRVDRPVAGFTISDSASSCTPLQVQFTNTSTFYSSSFWDFGLGQGSAVVQDPVHYYSVPGTFQVKLIVTSPGGCTDSAFKTVTVFDTTGSRVDYMPVGGCSPLAVTLNTFTSGPMRSFFWDFGDGYTQTTTTPASSHVYTTYGNFLPKVIMEDPSGCFIPVQGLDTILVIGADANFGFDKYLFCDTGTVRFIDSTTFNDPIVNYSWDFGDGGSSSLQNPVHQYLSPGLYTIQLAILTQNGCRDTAIKSAVIRVVASPQIDIGGDTVVCVNSSLLHSGIFIVPDTSAVGWSWNFPNGNSSSQQNPPAQVYNTVGNFTVTSIAINSSGCKDTITQNITVHPLPVVTMPGQITVQAGFPVTIPATYSPNTDIWSWSPAAGLSCTNCPNPDAGPKFNTIYQVYFTDDNGCTNSASIEVIVICKNANLFVPNTFSPNGDGSNDVFYPRGQGLERVRMLRIFNRWGEVVFEKREFPINDPSSGWDGTFKGKKPHADVYVYQVEVFCENGDIIRLNGNIALIL